MATIAVTDNQDALTWMQSFVEEGETVDTRKGV